MTDPQPNHIPGPNGLPPVELRELKGWLLWRYEKRPGEVKPRKVPHYVSGGRRHGKQGSPEDRAKLATFSEASTAASAGGFDGVGLAMVADWGLVALDFDRCLLPDRRFPREVEDIVSRTYAEWSPSGNGARAFVRGNLGDHKSLVDGVNSWGFEVFSTKGFVTVTGKMLPYTEALGMDDFIAPVDEFVSALCAARFGPASANAGSADASNDDFMAGHEPRIGLTELQIEQHLADLDPSMGREAWIRVGMAVHHETDGNGFDLWDDWSSDGHQYPGTEALQTQWNSFDRNRPGAANVTMATVIMMAKEVRAEREQAARTLARVTRRQMVLSQLTPGVALIHRHCQLASCPR